MRHQREVFNQKSWDRWRFLPGTFHFCGLFGGVLGGRRADHAVARVRVHGPALSLGSRSIAVSLCPWKWPTANHGGRGVGGTPLLDLEGRTDLGCGRGGRPVFSFPPGLISPRSVGDAGPMSSPAGSHTWAPKPGSPPPHPRGRARGPGGTEGPGGMEKTERTRGGARGGRGAPTGLGSSRWHRPPWDSGDHGCQSAFVLLSWRVAFPPTGNAAGATGLGREKGDGAEDAYRLPGGCSPGPGRDGVGAVFEWGGGFMF